MSAKYLIEGSDSHGDYVSYEVFGDVDEINHLCWCKALIRGISENYTMKFVEWL